MKKGTKVALAVATVIAVIITAAFLYRTLTANRFEKYVREKIAESKAAGDPLLLADIAPRSVADADNAAPVYERAFAALKLPRDNPENRKRWRDIERDRTEAAKDMGFVGNVLERNSESLELIAKASGMRVCRFKRDYTGNPWAIELQEMSPLMSVGRLVKVKAALEMAKGNAEEAFKWTAVALRIPQAYNGEPFLVCHITRTALSIEAFNTMQDALRGGKLTERQLGELTRLAAAQYEPDAMRRAIRCERAGGFTFIKMLAEGTTPASFLKIMYPTPAELIEQMKNPGTGAWFMAEMKNYLDMMGKAVAACDVPLPARLAEGEEIEQEIERIKKLPLGQKRTQLFSMLLVPGLTSVFTMDAYCMALSRAAQVAVEIEKHRLGAGQYPDTVKTIAEKLGEAAIDPHSGKPLLYNRTDKGYLVWSVGPNGKDDGAKNAAYFVDGEERGWDNIVWYGGGEKRPRPPTAEPSP